MRLVLRFATENEAAFGCNPAIHKYRNYINGPSAGQDSIQPPCLLALAVDIVPKHRSRKTRKMWRCNRIQARKQISNKSTRTNIIKYPRLSVVWSAIAEVNLLINCKWLSSTTLTPLGAHFSAANSTFSNYIWVVLVPWHASQTKQQWVACLHGNCCAV